MLGFTSLLPFDSYMLPFLSPLPLPSFPCTSFLRVIQASLPLTYPIPRNFLCLLFFSPPLSIFSLLIYLFSSSLPLLNLSSLLSFPPYSPVSSFFSFFYLPFFILSLLKQPLLPSHSSLLDFSLTCSSHSPLSSLFPCLSLFSSLPLHSLTFPPFPSLILFPVTRPLPPLRPNFLLSSPLALIPAAGRSNTRPPFSVVISGVAKCYPAFLITYSPRGLHLAQSPPWRLPHSRK